MNKEQILEIYEEAMTKEFGESDKPRADAPVIAIAKYMASGPTFTAADALDKLQCLMSDLAYLEDALREKLGKDY